jgi:Polyketide cyclase / dehydrase and lipid transport
MPSYEVSGVSKADPDTVWDAWTDPERWSDSDHIESARIDGPFREGAVINSKSKGLPASTLTVTRVEPPSLWVDETRSPGVRMSFDHVIEPLENGQTKLTERVVIEGPLAFLVAPLLRKRLLALFDASLAHVSRIAERVRDRSG